MSMNTVEDILVSIVVPVFNGEKYLKECLDSIICQSYKNIEVLLVDDGSTDMSKQIIANYSKTDKRVRYIYKNHSGLPETRKMGVSEANGEYVLFVDCDDWLDNSTVQFVIDNCRGGEADIVSYLFYSVNGEKKVRNTNSIPDGFYNRDEFEKYWDKLIFDKEAGIPGVNQSLCTKAFRKELLDGAFLTVDPNLTLGEDAAISYIALLNAKKIFISSVGLYFYRANGESMCHVANANQFIEIYCFQEYMREKLRKYDEKYSFMRQLTAYVYDLLTIPIRNCFEIEFDANYGLPTNCLKNGTNIVLFGAGVIGKQFFDKLTDLGCNVVAWVDSNKKGECIDGHVIDAPEKIKDYSYDTVLIAIKSKEYITEVIQKLRSMDVPLERIAYSSSEFDLKKWRERCLRV